MAMPEVPPEILGRLTHVEDAVQEFRYVHQVKTDATTNGLGMLYAQVRRIEHGLAGFRAETAVEFGAVRSELADLKTEQARQGEKLSVIESAVAEILRRLPEQGTS
jgi:hypothetical protein